MPPPSICSGIAAVSARHSSSSYKKRFPSTSPTVPESALPFPPSSYLFSLCRVSSSLSSDLISTLYLPFFRWETVLLRRVFKSTAPPPPSVRIYYCSFSSSSRHTDQVSLPRLLLLLVLLFRSLYIFLGGGRGGKGGNCCSPHFLYS